MALNASLELSKMRTSLFSPQHMYTHIRMHAHTRARQLKNEWEKITICFCEKFSSVKSSANVRIYAP